LTRPFDALEVSMPTTEKSLRPVESNTRVTIAFPFGSIRMGSATDAGLLSELAEVVADLTELLDKTRDDDGFADLAVRARELAERT
jgi:hypothetical protein